MMKKIMILIAMISAGILQLVGCGSGSSVSLPQQKTATVIFSASTSAALPTAVRIIKNSAVMPPGVTVPLLPNSKREVDPGALVAYKSGSTVFGSYSAPLLIVSVVGTSTLPSLGVTNVGDFVGVKVNYQAGLPLTEASFTGINPTFPDFAATGFDATGSSVSLTTLLKPAIRVTF